MDANANYNTQSDCKLVNEMSPPQTCDYTDGSFKLDDGSPVEVQPIHGRIDYTMHVGGYRIGGTPAGSHSMSNMSSEERKRHRQQQDRDRKRAVYAVLKEKAANGDQEAIKKLYRRRKTNTHLNSTSNPFSSFGFNGTAGVSEQIAGDSNAKLLRNISIDDFTLMECND